MSELPLWKRIGVHQNSNKIDTSNYRLSQRNQQVQPISIVTHRNQERVQFSSSIINLQIKEEEREMSSQNENHEFEERIFHQCFNKFKLVSKEEKEGGDSVLKLHCEDSSGTSFGNFIIQRESPLAEGEIAQDKQNQHHNKNNYRTNALERHQKINRMVDMLNILKQNLITIKYTLAIEKKELSKNITCIEDFMKSSNNNQYKPTQNDQSTQTNCSNIYLNIKPEHQMDSSRENIDCMFSTRPMSSILRKDMYLSQVHSEVEQYRDTSKLEICSLKQQIELLTLNTKMLEQQISTIRNQQEYNHKENFKLHMKQIERLYESNTLILRDTIQKHVQASFSKDDIISGLKNELNYKIEQIVILEKKNKEAIISNEINNNYGLYIRKYKDMYDACDKQKLKLIAQRQSHQQQIIDLKSDLEKLQKQSEQYLEENNSMRKKLEDANMLHMNTTNQYRLYSKEFQLKIIEQEQLINNLRQNISQKDLKIESLDRRLVEVINHNHENQTVQLEELPFINIHSTIQQKNTIQKCMHWRDINPKKCVQCINEVLNKPTESTPTIHSRVEKNEYLFRENSGKHTQSSLREQPKLQKLLIMGRGSLNQITRNKAKFDVLTKSYRNSIRTQTEQTYLTSVTSEASLFRHMSGHPEHKIHSKAQEIAQVSELSVRVDNLRAIMKSEIENSFRRRID